MSIPNRQAQMEQSIRDSLAELERRQDTISGMMALHFEEYDEAGPSLTLSLVPAPWMSNPMGVMHGGIVSSALDSTMGALSFCQVGEGSRTPTVTMSVTFLRPVPLDKKIYLRAKCSSSGRTLNNLTAELWAEGAPDRLLATACGTYFRASSGQSPLR